MPRALPVPGGKWQSPSGQCDNRPGDAENRCGARNFDPQLPVVSVGNYELHDGMNVRGAGDELHRMDPGPPAVYPVSAGAVGSGGRRGNVQIAGHAFPNVDFPRVVVALDAGDRPADLMMLSVTKPVEESVRRVPGVRNVRSTTSRGTADVSISFDWGTDMALATLQINAGRHPDPAQTASGNPTCDEAHGPDGLSHSGVQPDLCVPSRKRLYMIWPNISCVRCSPASMASRASA